MIYHDVPSASFISVIEVSPVPVHNLIVVSLWLQEEVHRCTDGGVDRWVLLHAPIMVGVVRADHADEWRSDSDGVVLRALPDFVQNFVEIMELAGGFQL